jgi:monofunctional biosynthetic peptidoglycan transglycosylase
VYLNVAEWGDGIFGAEAAAQARFGKSAKDLTRLEAARLAAVLPSPNKWSANKPGPYVRKRTGSLQARMKVVENEGYAACVLKDKAKPVRSPVAKGEPEPPEAVLPELPEAPAGSLPGDEAEMPLDNPLTEESEAALGVGPDAADDRLRPESPDAPAEPAEGLTEVGPADLRPALPETLPEEAAPAAER